MRLQSTAVKGDLRVRLRRIEGQVRGLQRLLDEDRDCREIMQQFKAIRAATKNASAVFMRSYANECLLNADDLTDQQRVIDELLGLLS